MPLFRHIDRTKPLPDLKAVESLRFAVDDEFPPFSFKESTGALNGFNVAIANAICQELKLACEFTTKKWDDLMPALERGEVDAVIAGVKVTEDTVETADFTNAYYRSLARFAVRKQNPLTTPDTRSLAGKRIGVVKGSAHEAWVMQYYSRSNIRPFATSAEAFTALRGAVIDAYFGDSLQIMFWLTGEDFAGLLPLCRRRLQRSGVLQPRHGDRRQARQRRAEGRPRLRARPASDIGQVRLDLPGIFSPKPVLIRRSVFRFDLGCR